MNVTREAILYNDLKRYLAERTVTDEEYQELCNWVA